MVKLHSYIGFVDNAKEAMDFYKSVFGGVVYSDTFSSYESEAMPVAEEDKDKIMHAFLQGDNGIELMGADTPRGMERDSGSRITLTLDGDDEALLRQYWDKLAAEGEVTVPLDKSPWGDVFGMLTDKYGVKWMVNVGSAKSE